MKILIIDNYDSFTYNLVQLVGKFTKDLIIKRNDKVTVDEIRKMNINKIIISPGPGRPEDSKVSLDIIQQLGKEIPVLGVCLGHQAIGISFGCKISNAPTLMHGKTSLIQHDGKTIYKSIEQNFTAGRYHSLVIDRNYFSDDLIITSTTDEGVIMGIRHREFPVEGIQFHPESILTPQGENLIKNWLYLEDHFPEKK
ncbi:MAG: aminodeoxychorismate/anthranilate synthase component II [Melioribacteraceae bacterium]|nr:aminodeoxychorismate/anthranilate synthase component II [Melioribacteraceae bacterium]MCF8354202.1 aminodeoxychorismate/anthranilate synthase component II [Melioribacteraceae bacterium]MCF8392848.1 aminodeoxychorismate/anthranilate synthase component II [Melioribacteraceae bacterium]MCF8418666.1 aminodeoxychorismate/anthranilate synthase component II [Melioribacteraceae bacterium]